MAKAYDQDVSSLQADCERYIEAAESLRDHIEDTELPCGALYGGTRGVLRGAGTMLDLDHGTHPCDLLQSRGWLCLRVLVSVR